MGDYRRDNDRSGGGGGRSFGNRNFGRSEPRQMHQATCSNCGKACEVPFRPNGSKPVLCSDCFRNQGNQDSRRPEGRNFERPVFSSRGESNFGGENRNRTESAPDYRAQFEALNAKLDHILQLVTPPPPPPLESEIAENVIEEVLEEVTDKPTKEKVTKKKTAAKKVTSKKKAE